MKEIKEKLVSVINYLIMHDDNIPNSEFCENVNDLTTVLVALNIDPVIVTFDSLIDRLEKCFVVDPEVGKRFDRELAKKGWCENINELRNLVELQENELNLQRFVYG